MLQAAGGGPVKLSQHDLTGICLSLQSDQVKSFNASGTFVTEHFPLVAFSTSAQFSATAARLILSELRAQTE